MCLPSLREDNVAGPVAAAAQAGRSRECRGRWSRRAGGVQIAGVIREALDGGGVADVDVLGVGGRIEGDAEGMVEAGGEGLDLRGFAIGADAAKDDDRAGAGVGEEEIAVGRGA